MTRAIVESPGTRYHSLDALRAVAMLVGVVIHAAMSFMEPVFPLWAAVDNSRGLAYSALIFLLHVFRMQIFFLLAGFFAAMLVERRGWLGFARHRLLRIGLPFLIGLVVLAPMVQWLFTIGFRQHGLDPFLHTGDLEVNFRFYQQPFSELLWSGDYLRHFQIFHLWFLWYLLWAYGVFLLGATWGRWLFFDAWLLPVMDRAMRSRLKPLWFALPTVGFMFGMRTWAADSPVSIGPEPHILAYYLFFFAVGWQLYRQRELLTECLRGWKTYCVLAVLLAPVLGFLHLHGPLAQAQVKPEYHLPAIAVYSLLTWLAIFSWMGFFLTYCHRPNAKMRYLSDAAYWVYLAHLPLVIALQILVAPWPLPASIKFVGIVLAASALSLTAYHWLVRDKWIGGLLNGKPRRS